MNRYSDFVNPLLNVHGLLEKLRPSEPGDPPAVRAIREASDQEIRSELAVADAALEPLVRATLFYLYDAIEESHRIAQNVTGDAGSYLHGMIHRREGDFENARYWFRRTSPLAMFGELHHAASAISSNMAAQSNWDPYLFVGECEQEKFGATENRGELVALQRAEFECFFDYVWRKSFAC